MEGKKLLLQRQKHIRLADRSEHGWKVVQEYEADELAADNVDEKRIAKAIKAADQKAAAEKKKGHSTSSRVPQARPSQFNRSQSQYPRMGTVEPGRLASAMPVISGATIVTPVPSTIGVNRIL